MTVDREQLLKTRLPEKEVDVPGIGTVRVRALSRAEVLDDLNTVDRSVAGAFEARLVAMSLVAPVLTEDDVRAWRRRSEPAEISVVVDAISAFSALTKADAKTAYEALEDDPDESFRVLPGGEAVDDGGPASG